MATPKILVVDDDPWTQRVVITALREHSPHIVTANDGATALEVAIDDPPDLVISDVVMPEMSGWTLVCKLRAHPRLALVPFIFLTALDSAEDKLHGFRLGADDYLQKPFVPEELALRVASVLRRRQATQARTPVDLQLLGPQGGFGGKLDDIGIASLLVLFELERKTGVLTFRQPASGERGRVVLRDGRVYAAYIHGGPVLTHAEAVYYMLGWASGSFDFQATPVESDNEIGATTSELLLEGARRLGRDAPAATDSDQEMR